MEIEGNDFELNLSFDKQPASNNKPNKQKKLKQTKSFKQQINNNQKSPTKKNNQNNSNQHNQQKQQQKKNNGGGVNQQQQQTHERRGQSNNPATNANTNQNNKRNNSNINFNNKNNNKSNQNNNKTQSTTTTSTSTSNESSQTNNIANLTNLSNNNFNNLIPPTNNSYSSNNNNSSSNKSHSIVDDPYQYHAKPKDLSRNALPAPQKTFTSNYIFTETTFSSLHLNERLSSHLENGGFQLKTTTRIQNVVIPLLQSERKNILMKSETGSGKTLAYLIPILNDLMTITPSITRLDGTYVVILAPTRELCSQINDVLTTLTKCCVSIVCGCIIGGEKRKSEKARLRKGITIVVGTPGRFLDHIKATESFNLNHLRWFVLDEADRLLDMGFGQTILEICSRLIGKQIEGLKNSSLSNEPSSSSSSPSSSQQQQQQGEARTNLRNKWQQQSLQISKLCHRPEELCFIMASATLTTAVKQLAMPLMSGNGFLVIDAEKQRVDEIRDINDLIKLGKDRGRLDGKDTSNLVKQSQPETEENEDEGEGKDNEENDDEEKDKKEATATTKPLSGDALVEGEVMQAPEQLSQYFMMTTCKWRLAGLLSFLQLHKHEKIMVFFSTCDGVDYHALLVNNTLWPEELDPVQFSHSSSSTSSSSPSSSSTSSSPNKPTISHSLEPLEYTFTGMFGSDCPLYRLHGNVPQRIRQQVYKTFSNSNKGILFCTDVAARGLDLPRVDWIVQYDPPCDTTDYIHRIGRTARKGMGGNSLIFLLPSEIQYLQLLESYSLQLKPLSLQSLFYQVSEFIPSVKKFNNVDEMTAVIIQRRVENTVYLNSILHQAGIQAYCSFIRSYAIHSSDTKQIFQISLLHLGHVAKCYGLHTSPSNIRFKDDVIGKIFNGNYRKELVETTSGKMNKKQRNEKYALSKQGGQKRKNESEDRSSDRKVPRTEGGGSGGSKGMKQKIRPIGLTASGSFRKTNGYFRKKLRTESKSEFQN